MLRALPIKQQAGGLIFFYHPVGDGAGLGGEDGTSDNSDNSESSDISDLTFRGREVVFYPFSGVLYNLLI